MSEIDVSKCDYYFQGRCGVSKNINYSIGCYANDCYYKQLQEAKKTIESQKGLITVGGRTQIELLAEVDKLKGKLEKIKEYCSETMRVMNNSTGGNAYSQGRTVEASRVLTIIGGIDD